MLKLDRNYIINKINHTKGEIHMNVVVGKKERQLAVGDVVQFTHNGSEGHCGYYLVCESRFDGYFIMNLSGIKSKVKYYKKIENLLNFHDQHIL
ncbi:MAG: hypothetical protein WD512_01410, partial [Candidatus Paceibacterota bacterium]